ncbi:MAG: hypothetical protein JJU41_07655 [Bacteroidetes bacterium]|nr:hypothetical protein [Bacteroidota bacterium]MCH8525375.1 hypothetical protein [Balneolales bacterium]
MKQYVRFFHVEGRLLAIQLLLLSTFVLAAIAKWEPGTIPAGFIEQFGETWLASLPGGLFMPYYTIAVTETLAAILFIGSIIRLEFLHGRDKTWLKSGLVLSLFIFVILAFGLRLTSQFDGTANTFFYFGATLLCLYIVEKEEDRDSIKA